MRARHVVTALALIFFSLPIALRVVGVKASQFENRAIAPAPKLSQGWDVFPATTRFFTDRMPLRSQAVTANRDFYETVFDTTPTYKAAASVTSNPVAPEGPPRLDARGRQVIRGAIGKDGWIFLANSLDKGCKDKWPVSKEKATADWIALLRELRAEGKNVVLVVAPDKESIYPEFLPDQFAAKDCFPQDRDEMWDVINSVKDPGFVPMRERLRAAKKLEKQRIYRQKDSHWNRIGTVYAVGDILKKIGGPVQLDRKELQPVTEYAESDLLTAIGTPGKPAEPGYKVVRPADAPKVPGKTLLMTDSFGFAAMDQITPYFENFSALNWDYQGGPGEGKSDLMRAKVLRKADTIILFTAERNWETRSVAAEIITKHLKRLRANDP
jgi:hypothetical protein